MAIVGSAVVAGVVIAIGCSVFVLLCFGSLSLSVGCPQSQHTFLGFVMLYLHDPLAPSMNNYERKQECIGLDEM